MNNPSLTGGDPCMHTVPNWFIKHSSFPVVQIGVNLAFNIEGKSNFNFGDLTFHVWFMVVLTILRWDYKPTYN